MTNKELAQKLLDLLGGKDNVLANAACMTRLRVTVKDTGNVDTEGIKALDGVMGLVEDDTMQIVLGPGKVNKVLEEFSKLTGLAKGVADESVVDAAATNKAAQKAKYESKPVQAFLKKISNVFVALLPGIIAAGLINVSTAGALAGEWWYQGIRSMGWALFAYLPILVGYNAAREFGGSAALGGIAGMMCIANSAMPLLAPGAADPATAILLPLTNAQYNPAAGGMIAALIAGAFFAWMERQIRKVMPNALDTFLSPLLVLIIGAFALMLVIQPYGATKGINYLLPILMMAGGGQVGAGLALYFKTKNAKLKKYVAESIPVGILGVGEPLMYAVTLPLVRPFVTACLGAGFGGAVAALLHIGTVSQGVSGLFGLLIVVPGQQLGYVAAMLLAYAAGFVLTWFFGVDERKINEFFGE